MVVAREDAPGGQNPLVARPKPKKTRLLYERRAWQILAATADKTEGMKAFVEKRPAVWKGR